MSLKTPVQLTLKNFLSYLNFSVMNNNPNQPRVYDAVLGGQSPPPTEGVVLGGLAGVKKRLVSAAVEERVAALTEALKYGEAGFELVIGALKDASEQVQHSASRLMRESADPKAKQALLDHDPWLFFTTLDNWEVEEFNPQVGITDPIGTAYALVEEWWRRQEELPNLFKILIKDSQVSKIQALLCQMSCHDSCSLLVNALVTCKEQLSSLKAVFIGDMHDYEYKTSDVELSNMSPVLAAYPNLEVLQVRGCTIGDDYGLEFSPLRHERLKTLIVETGYELSRLIIDQICALELPALEYLELWLGSDEYYYYSGDYSEEGCSIEYSALKNLMPIISGEAFPELKYLGLCSSEYSDAIAEAIVDSPLINRLAVLDLSMGTLTDEGAKALLNCPAINRLHTLNVAGNILSTTMIQRLSQLNCQVIAQPQQESGENRYYSLHE